MASVTVAAQIQVFPIVSASGGLALVTVITHISVFPVLAVSGAGTFVMVLAMVSIAPGAHAPSGPLITDDGQEILTVPVILSSIPIGVN